MRARHVINVLVAATVVAALSSCISFEETPTTFSVGTTTGESVWWIRMADVTGDGTDDALIKTSTGTLVRYEYCREGCFARRESVAVTRLSPYGCQYQRSSNCGVIVGDFDNDGVDDVRTGTRILFGGPATGDRPAGLTLDDSVVVPSYATNPVAVGDFNGDGNLDLLNEETQYGYYLSDTAVFGDGAGGFTQGPFLGMNGPTNACSECYLFLADFDGDGTDEVYTGGVLGQGAWPAFDVTNGYAIGDIDEDGRDDLAVRAEDGEVTFWRSTGDGFEAFPPYQTINAVGGFRLHDVDGDGHLDYLGSQKVGTKTEAQWLSGTADGGFPLEAASIPSPTEVGGSWAFGDVDGDGLDDAMLPGYGDTVSFFRNDSPT